jgi:hypothetical protein
MTLYTNHLTPGQLSGPWLDGLRRGPVERRARSAATPLRITARLVLAVVLEAVVLLATLQVVVGVGYGGQAGWQPTPGGASPEPLAAPARVSGSASAPARQAVEALAPLPAPAPPPAQPR